MRTEKREVVEKRTEEVYIAADGTVFEDTQMCREYERTAKCAVFSTYNKLVVGTISEYDLFSAGNDDNTCEILKISTTEDVETVMRALFFVHDSYKPDCDWAKKAREHVDYALEKDELLVVSRGYDPDECFWVMGAVSEIKSNFDENIRKATC